MRNRKGRKDFWCPFFSFLIFVPFLSPLSIFYFAFSFSFNFFFIGKEEKIFGIPFFSPFVFCPISCLCLHREFLTNLMVLGV